MVANKGTIVFLNLYIFQADPLITNIPPNEQVYLDDDLWNLDVGLLGGHQVGFVVACIFGKY